jgi:hypothetical protein
METIIPTNSMDILLKARKNDKVKLVNEKAKGVGEKVKGGSEKVCEVSKKELLLITKCN